MEDRAFYFSFQILQKNKLLNDVNVYQYEFINLSSAVVTLNNQLTFGGAIPILQRFKEDIQQGEKTATQYQVRFADQNDPQNKLLVITKIPVKLGKESKK